MRAVNHAVTGALIGLGVSNPALAIVLAFGSHFVLDAVPHYDAAGSESQRLSSHQFRTLLVPDALLCGLVVLALAVSRPHDWLLAAGFAFVATSPDLFWLPKFIHAQRTGRTLPNRNIFWRFHDWVQWWAHPKGVYIELTWLLLFGGILITQL